MVKSVDEILEQNIRDFLTRYRPAFEQLIVALNEAHISHYSSGCGSGRIAFDIFPASGHIEELLRMLSLDRAFKANPLMGLKDVAGKGAANPANSFLLFLRRWAGFAEQVMRREGDAPRGVAAARAKLAIDSLMARLGEGQPTTSTASEFAQLMERIGLTLKSRDTSQQDHHTVSTGKIHEYNYHKAMARAQNSGFTESLPPLSNSPAEMAKLLRDQIF